MDIEKAICIVADAANEVARFHSLGEKSIKELEEVIAHAPLTSRTRLSIKAFLSAQKAANLDWERLLKNE